MVSFWRVCLRHPLRGINVFFDTSTLGWRYDFPGRLSWEHLVGWGATLWGVGPRALELCWELQPLQNAPILRPAGLRPGPWLLVWPRNTLGPPGMEAASKTLLGLWTLRCEEVG